MTFPSFNRLIVELPVRHGKSVFCSHLFPSWFSMVWPHKQTILATHSAEFSAEWGFKVRNTLAEYGPELVGVGVDPHFRSRKHFLTTNLKGNGSATAGQFRAASPGTPVAGRGADLIVCDDLVKDQNDASSPTAREKLWRWFGAELLSRLEPDGKILVVMSRRHPDDLTGRLLATSDELPPAQRWHTLRLPAIGEDGTALWPQRFPLARLEQIRRGYEAQGQSYLWSSLYQQDPRGDNTALEWPDSYFDGIAFDDLPPNLPVEMRLLALDPSKGANAKAGDYACFTDVVFDTAGTLWVNPTLKRITTDEIEDTAVLLLQQRHFSGFICEANGFQSMIADNIARKCRAKGVNCPLHTWTNTENKHARIRMALTPLLAQKRVRLCRRSPQYTLALNQLREFPSAAHDDFPDALTLAWALRNTLLNGRRR